MLVCVRAQGLAGRCGAGMFVHRAGLLNQLAGCKCMCKESEKSTRANPWP